MNPRVLPTKAWTVVRTLHRAGLLERWLLAGGTGLALQLGHRVSVDLDFFAEAPFDAAALRAQLAEQGRIELQAQADNTLHVRMGGIRLSYLRAEVPFLFPPIEYRQLRVADARDIAVMKLVAVAGRGSRRDFVDLYAYFEAGGDFPGLIQILRQRYATTSFNEVHLLRSLVYFEDAEQEPMPRTLREISWPKVRRRLEDEVRRWAP